jgi:hypothetical protein
MEIWDFIDPLGLKEVTKPKFYKFLNENKLL